VYLLNHQLSLKHVVLFRVEVDGQQQKSNGQADRNQPSNAADPKLLKLLTQRRDTLKKCANLAAVRASVHTDDLASIGRVVAVRRELLRAEMELASTKEARILLLEQALQDQMG